jgi:hypothetical protein
MSKIQIKMTIEIISRNEKSLVFKVKNLIAMTASSEKKLKWQKLPR